jgi:hypothetical protein
MNEPEARWYNRFLLFCFVLLILFVEVKRSIVCCRSAQQRALVVTSFNTGRPSLV